MWTFPFLESLGKDCAIIRNYRLTRLSLVNNVQVGDAVLRIRILIFSLDPDPYLFPRSGSIIEISTGSASYSKQTRKKHSFVEFNQA